MTTTILAIAIFLLFLAPRAWAEPMLIASITGDHVGASSCFVGSATFAGSMQVISTGCNPCMADQVATFHIHLVHLGDSICVEVKAGVRLPDGGGVAIFGGEGVLSQGEFDIPLFSVPIPAGAPNGVYAVEVALLDPVFGVTLNRQSLTLQIGP